MVLRTFIYYDNSKKVKVKVKVCDTILKKFLGLMFQKNPKNLLFLFKKEKILSIHSFFCIPFTAIWLDENKKVAKKEFIDCWKPSISGRGKYLLEIPKATFKE